MFLSNQNNAVLTFHSLYFYKDEIVRQRALVHDTIYGHLASALLAGFPVYLRLGKWCGLFGLCVRFFSALLLLEAGKGNANDSSSNQTLKKIF